MLDAEQPNRENLPAAALVGDAFAALIELGGEAATSQIIEALELHQDPHVVEDTLHWLVTTGLVESIGATRWRVVSSVGDGLASQATITAGRALEEIAAWGRATLGCENPLEALSAARGWKHQLPTAVSEALSELETPIPSASETKYSIDVAFGRLEDQMPREFEIFVRRQRKQRPTLKQLGRELNVARERVRQLERAFAEMLDSIRDDPNDPIATSAARLRSELGAIWPVDQLPTALSSLGPPIATAISTPERVAVMLYLAGPYDEDTGWLVRTGVRPELNALLGGSFIDEPLELADVVANMSHMGAHSQWAVEWLKQQGSVRIVDDKLVRWGPRLADKAVAILAVAGEPLSARTIFEYLGEDRSFRSFKAAIHTDERIRRVGLDRYGLTRWGGEEYTSIAEEMAEEIRRRGGVADLDEVASKLARDFGVSPSSVRTYSKAPQFVVDKGGQISLARGNSVPPRSKPLELVAGYFKHADGWAMRKVVDREILRGSGFPVAPAFALELGVQPGQSVVVFTGTAEVKVSWRSPQPTFGSLRAFANENDAVEQDLIFLVARSKGQVRLVHTPRSLLAGRSGLERLALEIGLPPDADLKVVADTVGVTGPLESLHEGVRLRLQERGELQLSKFLPELESKGSDIVSLLVSLGE